MVGSAEEAAAADSGGGPSPAAESELLARLPAKYAVVTTPDDRAVHIRLLNALQEAGSASLLVMEWVPSAEANADARLYLVFQDRHASLKRICTVLSDSGIDISEASVFCTHDGVAVDLFYCRASSFDVSDRASCAEPLESLRNALVAELALDGASVPNTEQTITPAAAAAAPAPSPATVSSAAAAVGLAEALGGCALSATDADTDALTWPWPQRQIDEWDEKQFANLTLTRFVAEGSDSKVWEAKWAAATVAVKVLKDEPSIGKDSLKCFMSEVKIWRNLRHPHICAFMGTTILDGRPAIVLEFMRGGSLHALLHGRKAKPLESAVKASIALEVASGIAYLHSQGILHRDIKTPNILLDDQQHAKVADFGISRTFGSELTAETGTYRAMAPEVITHKPYGLKCDVYSFGMLLWELMHQEMPFREHAPLQVAFAVAIEQKRPPIHLGKDVQVYSELIEKCWKQDPDHRPDIDEVVRECGALLKAIGSPRSRPGTLHSHGSARSLKWWGKPKGDS